MRVSHRRINFLSWFLAGFVSPLLLVGAFAAEQPAGGAEKLGTVRFAISCNDLAKTNFTRAITLLHSFYFVEVQKALMEAAKADPDCAMVHWAFAMAAMENPYTWPLTGKSLGVGLAASERARQLGGKTERERDYIAAVDYFFRDADKVPAQTRQLAYELAMAKLADKYPDDTEARIFYALALSANYDPNDKSYRNQLRAAQMLEPILVEQPNHPGVSHYLIHSYDSPPLAQRGLASAYRYRDVAPSAPHALHMPSHTFTRLGMWNDSIAANTAVINATKDVRSKLHSWDYMGYAYLQKAQDDDARRVLAEIQALRKIEGENIAAAYALAAIPARMALERQHWVDAAALTLPISELDFAWQQFPHAEAVVVYARALGAARSGKFDAAQKDLARLGALKTAMLEAKQYYWADQADIQREAVTAWLAYARKGKDAIQLMRAAADHEDGTEKSAVTPGPLIPVREQLADLLMLLKQPRDALVEYEKAIAKEPNRFRSLVGAARAAEAVKDGKAAEKYYRLLVASANSPQGAHPEVKRAVAYLAGR